MKLHAALFAKRASRNHRIGIKDVSVAFLQSNKYADGKVEYNCFKHPVMGECQYFEQDGHIYGNNAAPVMWANKSPHDFLNTKRDGGSFDA